MPPDGIQSVELTNADNKEIYGTYSVTASWAYDITDVEKIINDSTLIFKVVVTGVGDASIIKGHPLPTTPYTATVLEVLEGECNEKEITLKTSGGLITLNEYKTTLSEEKIKKMGLDTISEKEGDQKYIEFTMDSDYKFKTNQEYIVVLDSDYSLVADGYSIFAASSSKTKTMTKSSTYTNVLTAKVLPDIGQ